jgi:DNA primase
LADEVTQRVKEANDIVEVIGEYLSLHKKGRTFKGLCPFHDDHNPSLDVDPGRQAFKCWACGKGGDVFTFVMEKDRLDFREALEHLARRAHIELKPGSRAAQESKTRLFEIMAWAAEQYHRNLLGPAGNAARAYLAERKLTDETIQTYQLGYAPPGWDWLAAQAEKAKIKPGALERLGLCAPRPSDRSLYDLFRDRIIFPIRDGRGRIVAFGGRILPGASAPSDAPKYYNSRESPLFVKSQHFYGIDRARPAAEKEGFLAIVEGYTDVLMAHQSGVLPVAATLGTALNGQHLANLGKFVRRVVLVYDADAGGRSGIDRALQLFIQNEIDLAIAALPEGQDPCDYLQTEGPEAFRARLTEAQDTLEFALERATTPQRMNSVAGKQEALDEVLRLMALIPPLARSSLEMKKQLALSRMAQQFGLEERVLWQRLEEMRPGGARRVETIRPASTAAGARADASAAPRVEPLERELLGILLVEPVRLRLADRPRLVASISALFEESTEKGNHAQRFADVVKEFARRRELSKLQHIRARLRDWQPDDPVPVELLNQALQKSPHAQ